MLSAWRRGPASAARSRRSRRSRSRRMRSRSPAQRSRERAERHERHARRWRRRSRPRRERGRRQHGEDARRRRHALAAAPAQPHRKDVADDRQQAGRGGGVLARDRRRASATAATPLPTSSTRAMSPGTSPAVRSTLVAPTLPLPRRRDRRPRPRARPARRTGSRQQVRRAEHERLTHRRCSRLPRPGVRPARHVRSAPGGGLLSALPRCAGRDTLNDSTTWARSHAGTIQGVDDGVDAASPDVRGVAAASADRRDDTVHWSPAALAARSWMSARRTRSSADWLAKNFTWVRSPGNRNVRTRVSIPTTDSAMATVPTGFASLPPRGSGDAGDADAELDAGPGPHAFGHRRPRPARSPRRARR